MPTLPVAMSTARPSQQRSIDDLLPTKPVAPPAARTELEAFANSRTGEGEAIRYAKVLVDYWRSDAESPLQAELLSNGLVELFQRYPQRIVEHVLHPVYGLPGRLRWLPRLSEVKEALDQAFAPVQKVVAEELAAIERERILASEKPESPEKRAAAVRKWEETLRPVLENAMPLNEQIRERRREEVEKQIQETPEETLARLAEQNQRVPVVIGEGLAQKLAGVRGDHRQPSR